MSSYKVSQPLINCKDVPLLRTAEQIEKTLISKRSLGLQVGLNVNNYVQKDLKGVKLRLETDGRLNTHALVSQACYTPKNNEYEKEIVRDCILESVFHARLGEVLCLFET